VSFQRPDRPSCSYGHLRLLFKVVGKISPDDSHTTEAVFREYAYMRMYEGAPANGDDKLALPSVVPVPNKPGVLHVSSFMPN
jgi:hypothetical protein